MSQLACALKTHSKQIVRVVVVVGVVVVVVVVVLVIVEVVVVVAVLIRNNGFVECLNARAHREHWIR
ncbi:hypothetical protein N9L68_09410 [bacterium]|nr:hypothetical protein [bacterium]